MAYLSLSLCSLLWPCLCVAYRGLVSVAYRGLVSVAYRGPSHLHYKAPILKVINLVQFTLIELALTMSN